MGYPEEEERALPSLLKKVPTLLSWTLIGWNWVTCFCRTIMGKGSGNTPGAGMRSTYPEHMARVDSFTDLGFVGTKGGWMVG